MWWCDTSSFWNAYESIKLTVDKWDKIDLSNELSKFFDDFNWNNVWKEDRALCAVNALKISLEELIAWKKSDTILWLIKKLPGAKKIMQDTLTEETIKILLEHIIESIELSYISKEEIQQMIWIMNKIEILTFKEDLRKMVWVNTEIDLLKLRKEIL